MDTIFHACYDCSYVQNFDASALTVNSLALDVLFEIVQHATCSGVSTAHGPYALHKHVAAKKHSVMLVLLLSCCVKGLFIPVKCVLRKLVILPWK